MHTKSRTTVYSASSTERSDHSRKKIFLQKLLFFFLCGDKKGSEHKAGTWECLTLIVKNCRKWLIKPKKNILINQRNLEKKISILSNVFCCFIGHFLQFFTINVKLSRDLALRSKFISPHRKTTIWTLLH